MKNLELNFPLPRPHTGVPLANGNLGVLVWGRDTLNLTVNQNDLWDHRGGELISEKNSYKQFADFAEKNGCIHELNTLFVREVSIICRPHRVPVGRFEFVFSENRKPVKAELDYRSGTLGVTLSDGGRVEITVVLKQNIIYLLDPQKLIEKVILRPASDFPKVKKFNNERGMDEYRLIEDGWIIELPEDPAFTVRAVKTAYGYKVFTNDEGDDSCMQQQLDFTANWWNSYFDRTAKVVTGDAWWDEFFTFNVYKFGAATCPFGKAGGLQGPWHEEYQECQWCGDFHFNVNVQMIYGPACALGVPEHLLPLFDLIESPDFQEAMRHNARALFKVDDALWQTHAVDDRGRQCGGISCGSALDPACGAWTALLYYDYYRYTGDVEFLRNRAWRYIYGIMRGYECMLDDDLNIPVAISAEYASSNGNMNTVAGRNPSYQLAAMRKLASILIECAEVLGLPERPVWRRILEKVPHFTATCGYDSYSRSNEQRIAIWENQDLEVCHRHHSHLGAIWPFDSLPEEPDEEMSGIIGNSIDHWISMGFGKWSEWCVPWANIIFTRTGLNEAPMQLFNVWKEIFINEGLCTVYLPRMLSLIAHRRHHIALPKDENEVMQLDGTCGFLSAFMEMCAYTRFDSINLFRGMPAKWNGVRIENLMLPGGGRLSAQRGGETVITGKRKFTVK